MLIIEHSIKNLNTAYTKLIGQYMLTEDRESKNMHKARRWIEQNCPDVIGKTLQNGVIVTPQKIIEEIRNTVPNVRLADCKFLPGLTRMYFQLQADREIQSKFSNLNKILKIICTSHADEYDNDLNGMTYDELDDKFSTAVQRELDRDKEEIGKLVLLKNDSDYEIVPIDSFEEAEKYGKYTSWCVTHDSNMYDAYTKNGLGRFYFCLKRGFENVPKQKGDGCPLDEYGKSMIAISVNDDGSLNTCTCRWNHDNGGDDKMMDTRQISEFFGMKFYDVFKPRPAQAVLKRYEKYRIADNDISRLLGGINAKNDIEPAFCVCIDNDRVKKYVYAAPGVVFDDYAYYYVKNGKFVKGLPSEINDKFVYNLPGVSPVKEGLRKVKVLYVGDRITTLDGCPECDKFIVHSNHISSLRGMPKTNSVICIGCARIKTLEGAPQYISGDFNCALTSIKSLKGVPAYVGGDFDCSATEITSLEDGPLEVGGNFDCSSTEITSLKGIPSIIPNNLYLENNYELRSLIGAPSAVGGKVYIDDYGIHSKRAINDYLAYLKHPTPEHTDDTGHYVP